MPYLADEADKELDLAWPADFGEVVRWAYEISIVRSGERFWQIYWDAGTPADDLAVISGATDGTAICRYHFG